ACSKPVSSLGPCAGLSPSSVTATITPLSLTPSPVSFYSLMGCRPPSSTLFPYTTLFRSLVAVIVAVPAATPLISPLPFTVATAGSLVDKSTTQPPDELLRAFLEVAANWALAPTCTLAVAGLTVTDATATGGGSSEVVPLA